jgi:hypothetical protein
MKVLYRWSWNNKGKLVFLMSLLMIVFVGCVMNPRIEDLSSQQRAKAASIPVQQGGTERSHQVVGTVSGLSCNRNKYQAQDVSDAEAMQGVKVEAALLDADAVINTICQKNSDTDWRNNCWASVKCIGDAVRYQ